jgi:NAD(P)-dependent dehydrogenase (short-subunit alcohol dehydrogenase family)
VIRFDGRAVLVTGAGRGLGRSYALELARRGASVVVNDPGFDLRGEVVEEHPARDVVAEIVAAGGRAVAAEHSVATRDGAHVLVDAALSAFGRLDAVVHNAGNRRVAPLHELSHEDFDAVLDVHLRGAWFVTRAALPAMRDRGYGRFVFTSSNAAVFGMPNVAAYAAAKMGAVGLCNVVAMEGEPHGILANVVMPAARTRAIGAYPLAQQASFGRQGLPQAATDPATVAALVVYLCSERCTFTHRIYSVTRGRFARVRIGVTPGWRRGDGGVPSAEEVEAHLAELDAGDLDFPVSSSDETRLALETLQRDS